MKAVKHTGNATGGPEQPISKPMDKPPRQYTSNETVPRDDFHGEPCKHDKENRGSYAKRFMSGSAK